MGLTRTRSERGDHIIVIRAQDERLLTRQCGREQSAGIALGYGSRYIADTSLQLRDRRLPRVISHRFSATGQPAVKVVSDGVSVTRMVRLTSNWSKSRHYCRQLSTG